VRARPRSAQAFGSPPGPYDQRVVDDVRPTPPVDPALIDELERGDLYPFWDYVILADVIGGRKTGVYTIWDDEGRLVYVGTAGRNPTGRGLAGRLRAADAAATSSASTSQTTTYCRN
jgi:hypothetical protein